MIIKISNKKTETFETTTSSTISSDDMKTIDDLINSITAIPKYTICSYNTQNMRPIPKGWALCDGTNNTPDLRDKFILGAGSIKITEEKNGIISINQEITDMFNLVEKNRLRNSKLVNTTSSLSTTSSKSTTSSLNTTTTTSKPYEVSYIGECRTADNNYPPYKSLTGQTKDRCQTLCNSDSRCSGYAFNNNGGCQLFDMTDAPLKGTAPSGSRLTKGNGYSSWTCYLNSRSKPSEYVQTKKIVPNSYDTIIYSLGDIGGEKEHTITLAELPTHSHDYEPGTIGAKAGSTTSTPGKFLANGGGNKTNGIAEMITATGNDKPHNNMPPYYVLVYIMKL